MKMGSPLLEKLTDADKKLLKEIHAKYGTVGKSPLSYVVRDGDQMYNIVLTK
jgi:hypothetical protein